MKKLSLNKNALILVIALIVMLSLLVTVPTALAWKEGPGTDWYYVDASYGGYHNSVPLVIKLNGDSSAGQVFSIGETIIISVDLHAVAQSCGGDGNGAYTEWLLEVNGPSGPGSTGAWNYDHSSGCAVADEDTTLTINYTLTTTGTHTVYMSSYAAVSQYWTDVAEDTVEDLLTFEVAAELDHFLGYKTKTTKVCDGGVTLLTLQYNGVNQAYIEVTAKNGEMLLAETVDAGAEFDIGTGDEKLGTEITITVDAGSETKIHTSCSQPIYPTQTFGDGGLFMVLGGESLKGGPLETPAPDFVPLEVTLTDQFETGIFEVKKPDRLYNPADKEGEGINDEETHLVGYKIKLAKTDPPQPKHEKWTYILVEDQFGHLFVDTKKPDRLLVPSLKDLENAILDVPKDFPVDHFKCYKVKVTKGTREFPEEIQVTVVDQFNQPKLYDVKKPSRLCIPVTKVVDTKVTEIKNPDAHLMCYEVKPAKGEPKHADVVGIYVNNQFGALQLDTEKEEELCVPSQKILP